MRSSLTARAVDLRLLAEEVCRRYRQEFPDEAERYGEAGIAWCIHDNQHILNWAILSATYGVGLPREQIAWLARTLAARNFPLDRLVRNLEFASAALRDHGAACRVAADQLPSVRSIVETASTSETTAPS